MHPSSLRGPSRPDGLHSKTLAGADQIGSALFRAVSTLVYLQLTSEISDANQEAGGDLNDCVDAT